VWMQQVGLEWAFRFSQEPARLWHRYFVRDLGFLVTLAVRTVAFRHAAYNRSTDGASSCPKFDTKIL
jgi:hypothetical protein